MKLFVRLAALIIIGISVQPGCRTFVPVEQTSDVLFTKNEVADYLGGYDIYMHGSNGVFRLQHPGVSGDTLTGEAVRLSAKDSLDLEKKPGAQKHRLDLYADRSIADSTSEAQLKKSDIKKVKLYGVDQRRSFEDSVQVVVIVIVGIVIAALLIGLLIAASTAGANTAGNASTNSSNGSNSGSNSGNSSNGGGSGSNSGCYVATMVYGSYDAPEVMVLRRFRDEKLAHTVAGRAFIRWYYNWSPGFVQRYHHLRWLHRLIRIALDRLVRFLDK